MKVTRWVWVRHAPVIGAEGHVYGRSDAPADTSDTACYRRMAELLPRDATWVHTGLSRTRDTAFAAARAMGYGGPMLEEPDLQEQDLGSWQGQPRAEIYRARKVGIERFWLTDLAERAPGGESFLDLCARACGAIERLTLAHEGGTILCFAHGGTIRAALGLALGFSGEGVFSFTTDNCSITRLDHIRAPSGRRFWRVQALNLPTIGETGASVPAGLPAA